jgi:hypothetical protein
MKSRSILWKWILPLLFATSVIALGVWAQQATSLLITGQSGEAKVIQVQGRNYVDVEGIARITNGSISFDGPHVVLTLPGSTANPSHAANSASNQPAPGFSKPFLSAGIEAMSEVREWRVALRNAVERSIPINEDWIGAYRRQSQESLRLAGVAANTDADRNAFPLVTNEFTKMNSLSQKYLDLAKSLSYIAPDSMKNDPLDQQILTCAHSLAAMASSNQFIDDGSCH